MTVSIPGFPLMPSASQTSPPDQGYNCIAWAACDQERFWWPRPEDEYYWPLEVRAETREAFVDAFETLGYEVFTYLSESWDPKEWEVVAFLQRDEEVRHAARQLPSGRWTSKLGNGMDIDHNIQEITLGYGGIGWMMRRRRAGFIPKPTTILTMDR
ncbi:MAG: hypothetical protein HY791_00850 [Deltaproteobacteria bacterium]|nr:hypothetical protein [Deltaproteobacteria bacterium]